MMTKETNHSEDVVEVSVTEDGRAPDQKADIGGILRDHEVHREDVVIAHDRRVVRVEETIAHDQGAQLDPEDDHRDLTADLLIRAIVVIAHETEECLLSESNLIEK